MYFSNSMPVAAQSVSSDETGRAIARTVATPECDVRTPLDGLDQTARARVTPDNVTLPVATTAEPESIEIPIELDESRTGGLQLELRHSSVRLTEQVVSIDGAPSNLSPWFLAEQGSPGF